MLAVLAVIAQAFVVVSVLWWLLGMIFDGVAASFDRFVAVMADSALPLAWVVSAVAMAGSLYFSESANFTPCIFCWYQRIAMYPLVLILGIAAIRGDTAARIYAMPLAAIGLLLSIYHVQLQAFPDQSSISCQKEAPCTAQWVDAMGYLSIPGFAGTAFAAILVLLGMTWRRDRALRRASVDSPV